MPRVTTGVRTPSTRSGTRSRVIASASRPGSMTTYCARLRRRSVSTAGGPGSHCMQTLTAGTFTATEMMTIVAARALKNRDVCFVGIGAPSAACNLARLTHAPEITLIYESGTIGARPNVLPLSIGDGELCETALTTVSVPEMFRYWLQG